MVTSNDGQAKVLRKVPSLIVGLLFVTVCVAMAEQQPNPPAPDEKKSVLRQDIVKYSDGKKLTGELFLRGETTLTLFDLERKDYRKYPFEISPGLM